MQSFSFLENDYDFNSFIKKQSIEYRSKDLTFEIFFEDISYEFYINVVLKKDGYYLDELFQQSIQSYEYIKGLQITNIDFLSNTIKQYAVLLEREYHHIFQNKKNLKKILKRVNAYRNIQEQEVMICEIRQKASEDWKNKDYNKVIVDYNQIKKLSILEKKRLIYSKKQVNKNASR